ncbi:DUF975 family protein [Lactobacillaceae bacterium L1_55_11]|nr:DUF975 family protein [Lactobacillaceae bacterium L1_55_11]
MDRYELKRGVKDKLHGNWGYVILVALPLAIMVIVDQWYSTNQFISTQIKLAAETGNVNTDYYSVVGGHSSQSFIIGLILLFVSAGVSWAFLDFVRNGEKNSSPFLSFIMAFKPKGLFWGTFFIGLLQAIWVFLWSLLLIVPGIIKTLSYSQALFIYRDKLAQGEKIGYAEAITLSRKMMDGHKWEYFVLHLSFLGWIILASIPAGLGYIWLVPYQQATFAAYYDQLAQQQSLEESDVNFG